MINPSSELKVVELENEEKYNSRNSNNPYFIEGNNFIFKSENQVSNIKNDLGIDFINGKKDNSNNPQHVKGFENDSERSKEAHFKRNENEEINLKDNLNQNKMKTSKILTSNFINHSAKEILNDEKEGLNNKKRSCLESQQKYNLRQITAKEKIDEKHKDYCHRCHQRNKTLNFFQCTKCPFVFCKTCIHFYQYKIETVSDFQKYCQANPKCPCCLYMCSCNNCYLKRKKKNINRYQEDKLIEGPIFEITDWRKCKYFKPRLSKIKKPQKKKRSLYY